MSNSDRSRSPSSHRSGAASSCQELPGFPRWCGPLGSAVRTLSHMPHPQIIPKWSGNPPRPYGMFRPQTASEPMVPSSWATAHPFPPSPPSVPPPSIPATEASICSPTQPCPPTPNVHISPSQSNSRPPPGPLPRSNTPPQSSTEARVYGFDVNEHWQADNDHYDNQKLNGLTFPRTIRSSSFTQKLDIEGCDPLALPLAALFYQHANIHWLRKLAQGREMYLIPIREILQRWCLRRSCCLS